MGEPETDVSAATRRQEERDAHAAHGADRPPTPEEEAEAGQRGADPDVARHEREMTRLGAEVEGEGRIP